MITPSDGDYKAAKRVKQGRDRLTPPFDALAQWIEGEFGVLPLYIHSDSVWVLRPRARLNVTFDREHEARLFRDHRSNYDADKQRAIVTQLLALTAGRAARSEAALPFVTFQAFEPVAIMEAHDNVPKEDVRALVTRLADPALWRIHREMFPSVTFLFHTNAQRAERERDGYREAYSSAYFDILAPHDEFAYLTRESYRVDFDSKERFEREFAGSWYNYSRR